MRVLTVCANGMGSSLILRMTVEAALKSLNIDAEVEACDTGTIASQQADLIVTSASIAKVIRSRPGTKIALVVNFVDRKEVEAKIAAALGINR